MCLDVTIQPNGGTEMAAEDNTELGSTGATVGSTKSDSKLELYKLEYERAAIRYEDIYKALWQIFSYLSAVTAALLAFGVDRFQPNLFWSLVCTPLLFWFWATYWPLNKYGDLCLDRLVEAEKLLNQNYKTELAHYTNFKNRRSEGLRVRYVVYFSFLVLHLIFLTNGCKACSAWRVGAPMIRERASDVTIVTVDTEELKKLIESTKSISQTPPVSPLSSSAKTKTK